MNIKPQNDNEPAAVRDQAGLATPAERLELTKAVLEFLGKCLYPAILITALVALWPTFSALEVGTLLGRLQSAKAGEYEFTFSQAQDVGAEIAPLNNKIVELERGLATALAEINRLQSASNLPKPSQEEVRQRREKDKEFDANSAHTLLVFHRATSRSRGATITAALLAEGFRSSDTETNFSELRKISPRENLVFLVYTDKGENIVPEVQKLIASVAPDAEVIRNPTATDLKRGDIQIFVF